MTLNKFGFESKLSYKIIIEKGHDHEHLPLTSSRSHPALFVGLSNDSAELQQCEALEAMGQWLKEEPVDHHTTSQD